MACPYFYPTRRLDWPSAPRLPLGAPYDGRCQAAANSEIHPEGGILRDLCNFGYARGRCPHFPPESVEADAVRFHAGRFILEKNYSPFRTGPVETIEEARLRRQAAVFAENLTLQFL